jgi:transcription antitermination factor NusA-like protein
LLHIIEEDENMQSVQDTNLQKQIDEALKRAKYKKVLYFYDESGYRKLLGVFDKKRASQIKKRLRSQNLINRLTEFEIRTTEPDNYAYTEEL